jgi:hypothetical protein
MAELKGVPKEVVEKANAELREALGISFNGASSRSTAANYEMIDSLLQVLYLRGVIKAEDIGPILKGEDFLP